MVRGQPLQMACQVIREIAGGTRLKRRKIGLALHQISLQAFGQGGEGVPRELAFTILDPTVARLQRQKGIGGDEGIAADIAARPGTVEEDGAGRTGEAGEIAERIAISHLLMEQARHRSAYSQSS